MNYNIVEIQPMQENTREELDRYLADVCQVVRDKDIKNPHALTDRLLKESYGNKPSSVFAFVPCVVNGNEANVFLGDRDFTQPFGFFEKNTANYHTNLRELLNLGLDFEYALTFVNFTHYKAFTARVPYFVYQQIRTHAQVQFLSHSARYSEVDYGYFMPDEVKTDYDNRYELSDEWKLEQWNNIVECVETPKSLKKYMKKAGVKRKEIYNRGADMLKIRPFSIGFNTLNPNSWEHFYSQRALDSHTQLECRTFVKELAKHVKDS